MTISYSVLFRMIKVSEKIVEKIKTHISCSKLFFFTEDRNIYEIEWKNMIQPDRQKKTIQYGAHMFHAG
jgi:hypothetical protein